jgi:hypothetical protein
MSYRSRDMRVSQEIEKFLDLYFYPKICDKRNPVVKYYRSLLGDNNEYAQYRYHDKKNQFKGRDLKIVYKNTKMIVDEKAAISPRRINTNLNSFYFELSHYSPRARLLLTGWFLNNSLDTTHYLLVWVWATERYHLEFKHVQYLKALMISKKKLLNYFDSEGFDQESLKNKIYELSGGKKYLKPPGKDFHFVRSTHLTEDPTGIVVAKSRLLELSEGAWIIYPSKIIVKK